MSQSVFRRWWFWALIVVAGILMLFTVISSGSDGQEVDLSQFIDDVQNQRVTRIEVDGRSVEYQVAGVQGTYETRIERGDSVREILRDAGIDPEDHPEIENRGFPAWGNIVGIILQFLPLIVIIGTLVYFFRRARNLQTHSGLSPVVSDTDPVCGAKVSPGESVGSSTFQNITYRFCSPEHKREFDSDPVKFLLEK